MFANLFPAVALSAAFDDAVIRDAQNGRFFRPLAVLLSTVYGLPTLARNDNPVNKAAVLKLAADYRADVRKGRKVGPRAWGARKAVGMALDLLAVTLQPGTDIIGDADAWETLRPAAPAKKAGANKAAPAGMPASVDADEATDAAPLGVALADALPVVIDAIKAGALSAVQRALLVTALAETAPAGVADAVIGLLDGSVEIAPDAAPLPTLTMTMTMTEGEALTLAVPATLAASETGFQILDDADALWAAKDAADAAAGLAPIGSVDCMTQAGTLDAGTVIGMADADAMVEAVA